ncbi:FUSC family protein [Tsukamurella paurometabola]|uniref:FUSC family protein n=1 Tax=Tsukamurella paurometabola TaxID=2061 RepID=A0ABS5NDL8_TSUPA|nr:FUSC family protein [Tsukamurella paurometabola]MBS4101543.1 FUSC family protein [Tsukamurella paurometabola]
MSEPVPEPPPRVARVRSLVFADGAPVWRWRAGLRAAAAVGIPGALLVATGHGASALFTTFGAFAVLYGEGRAYRVRSQVVAAAGLALLAAVAVGATVGWAVPAGGPVLKSCAVLMTVVPAVAAVFVVDALRLGPPGALFFALVGSGAVIAVESGADPAMLVTGAALGAMASVLVSMSGALIDPSAPQREAAGRAIGAVDSFLASDGPRSAERRHAAGSALVAAWSTMDDARAAHRPADAPLLADLRDANRRFAAASSDDSDTEVDPTRAVTTSRLRPTVGHRLRRSLSPSSHAAITSGRVGVACLVAGGVSTALGFERPHWAAISALVVLQTGVDRVHGTVRALHRFLGTAVGLVLFAGLHAAAPQGYALIAVVAVLQFCIEVLVVRNYAAAVVVITPVALLASGAGVTGGPALPVMRDRLLETVVGVVVALLAMHLLDPGAHRRTFAWTDRRIRDAAAALVDACATAPTGSAPAREAARHLHFELEGGVRAGIDSMHNEPDWAADRWPARAALIHDGYDLTARFWTTPADLPITDGNAWRRRFV